MTEIEGSRVVILGGTAGTGLAMAQLFAANGARLILMGRNPQKGADACDRVRDKTAGADIAFVKVDATDADSALAAGKEAIGQLGGIDTLICTTGPSQPPRLLNSIPIHDIQARIEEIILPPMHMIHAVLPAMRTQRRGAIINVASDAAKVATPGETLVGAAMAAIVMFSKALAIEEKRNLVRINMLTPSLIANTPGADLIFGEEFSTKLFEKAKKMAHLGVVEPEDLAAAALFLASPAARKMTGQAISINGGISVG